MVLNQDYRYLANSLQVTGKALYSTNKIISKNQELDQFFCILHMNLQSSVRRCWLGSRKGIWPVKNCLVRSWHGYLSGVRVQIYIWPSWCHCHSLSLAPVNPDWFYLPGFTFLVLAHPGNPGHSPGGCKMVVVVVVVVVVHNPEDTIFLPNIITLPNLWRLKNISS